MTPAPAMDIPVLFQVAQTAAAALALALAAGWPLARLILPGNASHRLLIAPALGLAVYAVCSLPFFYLLPVSRNWVMAVAAVVLAALWRFGRGGPAAAGGSRDDGPPVVFLVAAALVAALPAATVFPYLHNDLLMLGTPLGDHTKIAIIDAIRRTGVPPENPFYTEAGWPPRLVYYYLWYVLAAQAGALATVSGWAADIALTWVTAFVSLLLMAGLARWVGGRRESAWWVLILSCAVSLYPGLRESIGFVFGDPLLSSEHGFETWILQAAWVPQHLLAGMAALFAMIGLGRLAGGGGFAPRLAALTGALAAAAYAASTWVGGVTQAATAAAVLGGVLGLRLAARHRLAWGALVLNLGVAGAVALALAGHLLFEQMAVLGGSKTVVGAWLHPVFDEQPGLPVGPLAGFLGFWLVYLPAMFPAVWLPGVAGLTRVLRSGGLDPHGVVVRALALSSGAALLVSQLLCSRIFNNDLGWRAVVPAILALTPFAAAWMADMFPPAPPAGRRRWQVRLLALVVTAATGLGLYASWSFMTIDGWKIAIRPVENIAFGRNPALWAAVRAHTPPDEAVLNNPRTFEPISGSNPGWALFSDRPSCYAAIDLVSAYAFRLSPLRIDQGMTLALRVFAGQGTAVDLLDLRDARRCRTLVAVPGDGLWAHDTVAGSGIYDLVDEKPGEWRIYRAVAP